MFTSLLLFGLAAATQGQEPGPSTAELTANEDGLTVRLPRDATMSIEARQTIDVVGLHDRVGTLELASATFATAGQAREAAFQATVNASAHIYSSLIAMNSAQVAFQTDLRDEVASQLSTVTNDLTATVTAMATLMTEAGQSRELAANAAMSTLTATAAANTAALTSRMSALDASNTARMTALDSTITASLGSAVASLNQSVTVRLAAVTTALATKRGMTSHMFSGGCGSRQHGGWHTYCINRVVIDSARPFFFKRTDNYLRALVAGLYDMSFARLYQGCYWEHTVMMVGGRNIRHTHSWWHSGNWRDREIRALQPVNPGQDMAAKAYSNCGWITWHSGTEYDRFSVIWSGTRPA